MLNEGDPLRWFGDNASPAIYKAQAEFKAAVAAAAKLALSRRALAGRVGHAGGGEA